MRRRFRRTASNSKLRKIRRNRPQLERLEPRLVLDSTAVFSEIMYNPPGPDEGGEWIELYNQLAVDMDLSDWVLEGGVDYTFPDETVIPGHGYVVIASDPAALEASTGLSNVLGPFSGQLNDGGEELRLYNNDGRRMNVVNYGDNGQWPVGPDGGGASLSKLERGTASELPENWVASPQIGGTPGVANFDTEPTFITTTLLDTGHPVRALVPTNGSLEPAWYSTGFNDAGWLNGTTAVGYERSSGYDQYIGLDVESQLYNRNQTVYIRLNFDIDADLDDFDSLFLQMQYDDGFVAYLNGQEVARANVAGAIAWNSGGINHDDGQATIFENFDITGFKDIMVQGTNVLAIRGLNQSLTSSDSLYNPKIAGAITITGPGGVELPEVSLNEIASASDAEFFVELANGGATDVDLGGFVLASSDDAGSSYTFPEPTILNAGGMLALTAQQLGFQPVDGNKVFLYTADQEFFVDSRVVTNRLRGRSPQHEGRWLYPDTATPGAANSFQFNEDVVINEIMYHAFPVIATQSTPFAEDPEEWIELYNRGSSDVDLTGWQIEDGIRYDFPDATMIPAGGYLIISNDPVALSAKYPGLSDIILGNFSGGLSNADERIQLTDSNKNPADEVHYHDAGQWPEYADGGGSSLELRDPFADNSKGAAWEASDEASKSSWTTFSVQDNSNEPLNCCSGFNELILGLLDSGEFLIDDVSVIGNPNSTRVQMMQNGSFSSDAIGSSPQSWRLIGNHSGTVEVDPDDPSNRVLHVVAAGTQQHVHDHLETTFAGNRSVTSYSSYEISFRAKWLGGNSQINSRLYFTRASNTAKLNVPEDNGTPGAANSVLEDNIGPTYSDFGHSPILPSANQAVTVSARASDPDAVSTMTLRWRLNTGAWNTAPMSDDGSGLYTANVPGQNSGSVVQFYVRGVDGQGAVSTFPAKGADSRALYQVNDGQAPRPISTIRLIMLSSDNSQLFTQTNRMSNNFVGGTVLHNNNEVFYDVGIRQIGSRYIRPNSGYKVRLNPEQKFYGVHDSIRLDINGVNEILYKQMVNRAGGSSVTMYDDIAYLISPQHSARTMLLNLARYENIYLDEQFVNGSEGTKFELDDITYPTGANPHPEGLKGDTGVSDQDWFYRGENPEDYRGQLLIKNQRAKDDFQPIVEVARAMSRTGQQLYDATNAVMDVDLWMRHYATQSYLGNWDTYGFRRPKNIRIYTRPEDGKVIPLYWDADLANLTEALIYNGGASRLDEIRNIPQNTRLFWGHMWDLMNRAFNPDYTAYWAAHYNELGGGTGGLLGSISNRTNSARAQARSAVPEVAFQITTNFGNDLSVATSQVTLSGDGWINVREIRLAGSDEALDVSWTDQNSWRVTLPVAPGPNTITLEAYDFEGNPACDDNPRCTNSTDTILVTSTDFDRPVQDYLRISELMYNPIGATESEISAGFDDGDDFEYIELVNTSQTQSLSLTGASFANGVDYTFPAGYSMTPNSRVLLVRNQAAFAERYEAAVPVLGEYLGSLSNNGEQVTLLDGDGATVLDFDYNDQGGWPGRADGSGSSLQIVNTNGDYNAPSNWRASVAYNGTPGQEELVQEDTIVVNEVLSHTDLPLTDSIELLNVSTESIDISGWFLSDSNNYQKFAIPAGTILQAGDFIVFDEDDFNPTPETPGPNDFALNSAHGDDVWLLAADPQGKLQRFVDHVEFGAQANAESWGRWPSGQGALYPLQSRSLGTANSGPRVGPLVISEIMYNAPDPDGPEGIDPDDLEFVEIFNPLSTAVDLTNWRLVGGVDYDFDPGTMIAPESLLVVLRFEPSDPLNSQRLEDFRGTYNLDAGTPLVGGYSGILDNGGESVRLQRPDEPPLDEPDFVPRLLEDEVIYDDDLPWPTEADAGGFALSRISADMWGNDPVSWIAVPPTPGSVLEGPPVVLQVTVNGALADPSDIGGNPQPSSWLTQRSDIRTLVVTFSALITATESDFVLTSLGVDAPNEPDVVVPLTADHLVVQGNRAILQFDVNELPEGVYQLQVLPTLENLDGEALDGNGDGVTGDAYAIVGSRENTLYRLTGDFNGDIGVSIFDFPSFAYWFGVSTQPVGGAPTYVDMNGDGGVTIFDFPFFADNFGKSVVFPAPLQAAVPVILADRLVPSEVRSQAVESQQSLERDEQSRWVAFDAEPRRPDSPPTTAEDDDLEAVLDDLAADLGAIWSELE